MRNTVLLLAVLTAMVVAYFLFVHEKGGSSLDPNETAFSISDTAAIDRIQIQRVENWQPVETIVLDRASAGGWKVNGEYFALEPRVTNLLGTLVRVRVREALPEASQKAGIDMMGRRHTHVKVYAEGKQLRSLLIGTEARHMRGTLMMLEKAKHPYIVEIPGFQGYLNSRFSIDTDFWKENLLFKADRKTIHSISVSYPDEHRSFQLIKASPDSVFQLTADGLVADPLKIEAYLQQFGGKIYAAAFADKDFPDKLEELRQLAPTAVFEVGYIDGAKRRIFIHARPDNRNNYFGWVDGEDQLLLIQDFVFTPFLVAKDHFRLETDS